MLSCQLVTVQVGIEHPHVGLDSGKRRILLTAWKLRFELVIRDCTIYKASENPACRIALDSIHHEDSY